MKPHRGTLVLVLEILSLTVCCGSPLGIAPWIMGNIDLKEMDAGRMDPTGRGITNGGRICGIIGVVLMGLWILSLLASCMFGMLGAVMSR